MARSGPISLNLPSFSGATRTLILITLAAFFTYAILGYGAPEFTGHAFGFLPLIPALLFHGQIWRLVTYEFLTTGPLELLLSLISLWFVGSMMEDRYGSRWLIEFYLLTSAASGLLASLLAQVHFLNLSPAMATLGPWSPILALLLAFAVVSGEQQIIFIVFTMKAKYLVALYVIYYLAILLVGSDRFGALTCLCGALAGFLYMRFAPRRGYLASSGFNLSERFYALRNDFYRRKRRNAAKKFEVYMKKQNRDVHFDKEGRYIAPDDRLDKLDKRDPTDKRWMN